MASGQSLPLVSFQRPQNSKDHQTFLYRSKKLVVRRAQPFTISLSLKNGGFETGTGQMSFTVQTGPYQTTFPLSNQEPKNAWGAVLTSSEPRLLDITIFSPPNAIIGLYSLTLQFANDNRPITLGEFILLFNPWSPGDTVFLGDEAQRQEYVMNDYGVIFQGNYKWIQAVSWNYGQFEESIVDICLALLDHSINFFGNPNADYSQRGDPAYVSRVISAMVNANDDNGVVLGKWDGDFTDGTKPTDWNGSVALLRQWQANGFKPVKYGQCWVFAGVLCTVMRSLGIPTRVISNFESAHDANGDLIIDQYFDKDGKHLKEKSEDSIWNFHCWNECWMARLDLSTFYNGWQVVDATPQEPSNGIFCCGPAPVKAIKEGIVNIQYDSIFAYGEVNADIVSWVITKGKMEKVNTDTATIGKNISTKGVGTNERVDVTYTYKYNEGSAEERNSYQNALQHLH